MYHNQYPETRASSPQSVMILSQNKSNFKNRRKGTNTSTNNTQDSSFHHHRGFVDGNPMSPYNNIRNKHPNIRSLRRSISDSFPVMRNGHCYHNTAMDGSHDHSGDTSHKTHRRENSFSRNIIKTRLILMRKIVPILSILCVTLMIQMMRLGMQKAQIAGPMEDLLFIRNIYVRDDDDKSDCNNSNNGVQMRPMVVQLPVFEDEDVNVSISSDESVPLKHKYFDRSGQHRFVKLSRHGYKAIYDPTSSRDIDRTDPFQEGSCKESRTWQVTSFPACNSVHEVNLATFPDTTSPAYHENEEDIQMINNGYWRDVWKVRTMNSATNTRESDNYTVLKTMRYRHDYTERNFDRHRRDAVAMERLTGKEDVVDIYGYCGNSGIFQYSQDGDVYGMIWGTTHKTTENENILYSPYKALQTAEQISSGIAAAHTFDYNAYNDDEMNNDAGNYAKMAHTDITPTQFVMINGRYRLNDFNRCRFIRWDTEQKQP